MAFYNPRFQKIAVQNYATGHGFMLLIARPAGGLKDTALGREKATFRRAGDHRASLRFHNRGPFFSPFRNFCLIILNNLTNIEERAMYRIIRDTMHEP
jgi:hypothetical protein